MVETHTAPPPTARTPRGARDIRSIAVRADRDPRAVVAAYAGLASPAVHADVTNAATALGYAPPRERT
jgi:hypothetical protein